CRAKGIAAIPLKVSNAFHSTLVSSAAEILRTELKTVEFQKPDFPVLSTITGNEVEQSSVRQTLCQQILEPVRLFDAVKNAERFGVDAFIEVGPGHSLGSMVGEIEMNGLRSILYTDDAGGTTSRQMNLTLACLFALGAPVRTERLFENRFTRPFSLSYHPSFIQNPCEIDEEEDHQTQAVVEKLLSDAPLTGIGSLRVEIPQETEIEPQQSAEPAVEGVSDYNAVLTIVLDLAAEITEYPRDIIKRENLLLRDLNLNSIASAQLAAEAARRLNLPRPADVTEYSTASLEDIAHALYDLASTRGISTQGIGEVEPPGISSWVRPFIVEMKEELLPLSSINHVKAGQRCLLITGEQHPFSDVFMERLTAQGVDVEFCPANSSEEYYETLFSSGQQYDAVIFVLPQSADGEVWKIAPEELRQRLHQVTHPMFTAGKYLAGWVAEKKNPSLFVGVIQFGGGLFGRQGVTFPSIDLASGSGFLKSLFLELSLPSACVVDVSPEMNPTVAANITLTEFQRASGFVEVGYTDDGTRRVPQMKLIEPNGESHVGIEKDDVLLVTGGGRGIAAECALAIARECSCKVALVGRTSLEGNGSNASVSGVRATLARFEAAGILHRYEVCDVSDASSVAVTIKRIEQTLGPVTAVLHGAGNNVPQATKNLSHDALTKVLAPKIFGTTNLLRVLDLSRVKLFIAFGSIIGQTGMRGETAYAFANEWMNLSLLRLQQTAPLIKCLSLNWSVWSGIGMGEQLGSVDALVREGITPIEPGEGVNVLLQLIRSRFLTSELLINGRMGKTPTRRFAEDPLPLLRFLDRRRVYYAGVELICECDLSTDTDLYLNDHVFEGMHLFPAVMGIEAMVQLASVLASDRSCTMIENLELMRPIMIPPGGTTTIRIMAQVSPVLSAGNKTQIQTTTYIDVVIRSAETKFAMDHFRGRCVFGNQDPPVTHAFPEVSDKRVPLSPQQELYGGLLFQGPMFQHLTAYRELSATRCLAEIDCRPSASLFGRYFPQEIVTDRPTVRDVFLHAIQPCVPQQFILPLSIERIRFIQPLKEFSRLLLEAVERESANGEFLYDVHVFTPEGQFVETLEGFRCRSVGKRISAGTGNGKQSTIQIPVGLLAPYLERELQELYPQKRLSISTSIIEQIIIVEKNSPAISRENELLHLKKKRSSQEAMGQAVRNLIRVTKGRDVPSSAIKILHQENGKPEIELSEDLRSLRASIIVSATHSGNVTLAIAGEGTCACDLEVIEHRSEQLWIDLLGEEGTQCANTFMNDLNEPIDVMYTRMWTMKECLKKAGISRASLPLLSSQPRKEWLLTPFRHNGHEFIIATHRLQLKTLEQGAIVAVLLEPIFSETQRPKEIVSSR
ncbi:MAG: SDR family NAD(P)-dependent oxidoreductase, partial [Ignavibacteria bacterium]|nr:SDR family NAD(P)-dependent oxidoreductase [Ignavibacteria bacterium]